MPSTNSTARCMAGTFAVTSCAFGPALASMAASASTRASAVTPSISDDEANSVRSRTDASGASSVAVSWPSGTACCHGRHFGVEAGDLSDRVLGLGLGLEPLIHL